MVETPKDLDAEDEELLRRFAESRGETVSEPGNGLFSRIRQAFN